MSTIVKSLTDTAYRWSQNFLESAWGQRSVSWSKHALSQAAVKETVWNQQQAMHKTDVAAKPEFWLHGTRIGPGSRFPELDLNGKTVLKATKDLHILVNTVNGTYMAVRYALNREKSITRHDSGFSDQNEMFNDEDTKGIPAVLRIFPRNPNLLKSCGNHWVLPEGEEFDVEVSCVSDESEEAIKTRDGAVSTASVIATVGGLAGIIVGQKAFEEEQKAKKQEVREPQNIKN